MNVSNDFYKNPDFETLLAHIDEVDWNMLSVTIEKPFSLQEIKLFYEHLNISIYIQTHYITNDVFEFLDSKGKISFGDKFAMITQNTKSITDENIQRFCGDYPSLWAAAFENNNISEDVLIDNFSNIISRSKSAVEIIKCNILERHNEDKYNKLLLLLELNNL